MNKKVLTLCAGFLLAGGMLSSVSAVDLTKAEFGKYYKLVRAAALNKDAEGVWSKTEDGYSLEVSNDQLVIDKNLSNGVDYWKITVVEGEIYELTNFAGTKSIKVTFDNSASLDEGKTYLTQLKTEDGSQYYFMDFDGENPPLDQYVLVQKTANDWISDGTLYSTAFDAIETSLQDVTATDNFDLAGKDATIKFVVGSTIYSNIYKATYDEKNKSYSFADNVTGDILYFTDANGNKEKDVVIVPCENGNGSFLQLPSGGKYVNYDGTSFTLVDAIENATMFGFQITNTRVAVSVDVLNYYEKDGFSVEINGYDTKNEPTIDLAGNPFTGHLTPMVLVSENGKNVFKKAADQTNVSAIKEYYLKDEDGNYIVAMKYNVEGAESSQALYKFTTVTEEALIHNITRAWNNELKDNQIYFGKFRASVDEAALDEDKTALDEITWLEVNIDPYDVGVATYHYAELGQANIGETPTLVAVATKVLNQFKLYPIHISLQPGNLVDWKEFLQAKFYTVEKVEKDGTNDKLTAKYDGTRWTSGYGNELEGQFALEIVEVEGDNNVKADYYQFTNRETLNSIWTEIPVNALYTTDEEYTYKCAGETYIIKPVAEVSDADGYKRFSDSELNRQYHVAFSSDVFDSQAYLSEEHADAEDPNAHVISLNPEKENALVFNVKKYNAARDLDDENKDTHEYTYHPTDSIYVISRLGFYNTKTKEQDFKYDTLKVVTYSFVNQFTEPLMYGVIEGVDEGVNDACYYSDVYANDADKKKYESVAKAHEAAQKFAVRYDGNSETKYNLRPVELCREEFPETDYVSGEKSDADLYQIFAVHNTEATDDTKADIHNDWKKVYAGDVTLGILDNVGLYAREENDLFVIEETESEVYRRLANNVDTISIYRNDNEKSLLYEKYMKVNDTTSVSFLGMENIADFTKMAPAMIADTAYVRYDTYKPQYMLVVDPTIHPAGKWCDVCESADCEHAVPTPAWTEGRFLVNLVDSAKAWDEAHKHQVGNPYKNSEGYYKLGFVQATHRNDSLIVNDKKQFIGNNDNHLAKFQFRYVDTEDQSFVIETSLDGTQTPGYLKWMNGVVVVVDDIKNADVYNMNEDESRTPTANEEISAEEATVSVVATDGAVIVKGAEGKNVVVSTILGKVVANEVLNSDNETIAAPAGIVVVSVDGESFKVAVK